MVWHKLYINALKKNIYCVTFTIKQYKKNVYTSFSISLAIVTPFYSASLVETVQSDIASDKPAVLDVFREGFVRILEWGTPSRGRMLPIWAIVMPSVGLGISKYFAQ